MLDENDLFHTHDKDEAGVHNSFKGTKQEAIRCHTSKVGACWCSDENDTPD